MKKLIYKILTFIINGGYSRKMSISKFQKLEG